MPERAAAMPAAATNGEFSLVHPLDEFYVQAGLTLPPLTRVEGQAVPQPQKTLLVHQDDMTPTLEKYYARGVHLQVLGRRRKSDAYFREVILRLDGSNQPVEFGAIKIDLTLVPAVVREAILREQLPFGHILAEFNVPHTSRPRAYLRLASDKFINEVLEMSGAQVLYGRRNALFDTQNRPIAEIVEILPAADHRENATA